MKNQIQNRLDARGLPLVWDAEYVLSLAPKYSARQYSSTRETLASVGGAAALLFLYFLTALSSSPNRGPQMVAAPHPVTSTRVEAPAHSTVEAPAHSSLEAFDRFEAVVGKEALSSISPRVLSALEKVRR